MWGSDFGVGIGGSVSEVGADTAGTAGAPRAPASRGLNAPSGQAAFF